jgi:hypothetical protein
MQPACPLLLLLLYLSEQLLGKTLILDGRKLTHYVVEFAADV